MGLHLPRPPALRSFRFEHFHFAEALVVEAVLRHVRGARQVYPTAGRFPRQPPHPSAIAVIPAAGEDRPRRRLLVDSARRVVGGLKAKRGFSRTETFYREMLQGFRRLHRHDSVELEIWSFDGDEADRADVGRKLLARLDGPVRWVDPAQIAEDVRRLEASAIEAPADADDLRSLLALLGRLRS